jgi:hypothetical protein
MPVSLRLSWRILYEPTFRMRSSATTSLRGTTKASNTP